MEITIGGNRLGSGKKMTESLNNYHRSTHDLSYLWRSTMSAGTLVPFMCNVMLPGDTFDIDLNAEILTHPTIGPLFGSYKVQLDVFAVPVRLYQAELHMNKLGIGMKMSNVKLPYVTITANNKIDPEKAIDNQQINGSSLAAYLGIRGIGYDRNGEHGTVSRDFNAVPLLAYWDIYKNYYANKMEEVGAYIHNPIVAENLDVESINTINTTPEIIIPYQNSGLNVSCAWMNDAGVVISFTDLPTENVDSSNYSIWFEQGGSIIAYKLNSMFSNFFYDSVSNKATWNYPTFDTNEYSLYDIVKVTYDGVPRPYDGQPVVKFFELKNIDDARTKILQNPTGIPFKVNDINLLPYEDFVQNTTVSGVFINALQYNQECLALKTYQSDLFNNWLSTEWIDGENGINAITAISTIGDSFTIDELNMSKKIYDMLNRIALSGGTYDDWLSAVYTHDRKRGTENPVYLGGLIKELAFQEVISNAATEDNPLGTIAGKGKLTRKHKGGHIIAKCDEPSYLIGLVSITPRVDYSQGNSWDVNLRTMDDFHKPALDQIGFQDLVTDQMAFFDTAITNGRPEFRSAGKQPAWLNYMTAVNIVRGNFADPDNQMFMTLNRRYEAEKNYDSEEIKIKDLTTYIDPSKFNYVFAQTSLDSQNFWTQISCDITARRKMSAKLIPNL